MEERARRRAVGSQRPREGESRRYEAQRGPRGPLAEERQDASPRFEVDARVALELCPKSRKDRPVLEA